MSKPAFHVLGAGNIGCLIAASLPPSVSANLILRSQAKLVNFRQHGSKIKLRQVVGSPITTEREVTGLVGCPEKPFENLIVATKAHQATAAVKSVLPAINSQTNVLLIQNGLGVYEEIMSMLLNEGSESNLPNFHLGILSHGVHNTRFPWEYNHAGQGTLRMTALNGESSTMTQVLEATNLNTQVLPSPEFLLAQLEKLVVNAVINPLTAIYGCRNGTLLEIFSERFINHIVNESCIILRKHFGVVTADDHTQGLMADITLDPGRVTRVVYEVAELTGANKSSMLVDLETRTGNELHYINGYLVKKAKEYGVSSSRNKTLVEMVNAKLKLLNKDDDEFVAHQH